MKNEYGNELDRNQYADSILQGTERCYLCGRTYRLQRHEVYNGSYRTKSKRLGCWVLLCAECHHDITHINADRRIALKQESQLKVMDFYGIGEDEFRQYFGKSYL